MPSMQYRGTNYWTSYSILWILFTLKFPIRRKIRGRFAEWKSRGINYPIHFLLYVQCWAARFLRSARRNILYWFKSTPVDSPTSRARECCLSIFAWRFQLIKSALAAPRMRKILIFIVVLNKVRDTWSRQKITLLYA